MSNISPPSTPRLAHCALNRGLTLTIIATLHPPHKAYATERERQILERHRQVAHARVEDAAAHEHRLKLELDRAGLEVRTLLNIT